MVQGLTGDVACFGLWPRGCQVKLPSHDFIDRSNSSHLMGHKVSAVSLPVIWSSYSQELGYAGRRHGQAQGAEPSLSGDLQRKISMQSESLGGTVS